LDAFKDTAEALTHWQDLFSIDETLEVETPFEFVHPDDSSIVVRGRPDRVVVSMGRIFHMQHRSLAAGRNIAQYTEPAKLDMHELVYAYHLRTKYAAKGLSYGGTIFNIIRKLKYRGVNGTILQRFSDSTLYGWMMRKSPRSFKIWVGLLEKCDGLLTTLIVAFYPPMHAILTLVSLVIGLILTFMSLLVKEICSMTVSLSRVKIPMQAFRQSWRKLENHS
jgi:hypothetical protein